MKWNVWDKKFVKEDGTCVQRYETHPRKASSLSRLLSSSSIPCISLSMLPLLCMVGLRGIGLSLAGGTGVCDLDPPRGPRSEGDIGVGDRGDKGDDGSLAGDAGKVWPTVFARPVSITKVDFCFRKPNLEEIVPATDRRRLLIERDAKLSLVCG